MFAMKRIHVVASFLLFLPLVALADSDSPQRLDLPQTAGLAEAKSQYEAVATKAKTEYRDKISGALRQLIKKLDQADKMATKASNADEIHRIAALKQALQVDPLLGDQAIEDAVSVIDQRLIKTKIIMTDAFNEEYAKSFPPAENRARGGIAKASSTANDIDDPLATLGGCRRCRTWALGESKGWYLASWTKPISGRYIVIYGRSTPVENDKWGKSHIVVNNTDPIDIQGMCGSHNILIDLGQTALISQVRIDFDGTLFPGIDSFEVFPDHGEH